ncbi:hypothetical protein [Streptomyces tendae]|uniref:hypothetical protein n=1 Tax=Streptomyces tendae TaxID=1932 RepID=UPI0036C0056C
MGSAALLGSRRMNTFDHNVDVESFLQTLERNGIGLAAQANDFDKLLTAPGPLF